MLQVLGLSNENSHQQAGAYNLLATREWMLLVPRSLESFESIPVNSLGFAGTLAVRSQEQIQILIEQGPMTVLKNVAVPTALPSLEGRAFRPIPQEFQNLSRAELNAC
jgi:ATP adenylyltransferase